MYLTLLALPMLGAMTAGILGRKIGVTGAHMITCTTMGITAVLSFIAFYEVGLCHSPVSIRLGS
jgi:NADH-ubiquinone oxidoreductase chain 5